MCVLELELIQSHMAQKPVLWGEVGGGMCVAFTVATKVAVCFFPAYFQTHPTHAYRPPHCPWATRRTHACCLKRLPLVLGVGGAEGVCFKSSKLSTTTTTSLAAVAAASAATSP